MEDTFFMQQALALAQQAARCGEVPVGCVIARGDQIVGRGQNRRESGKNALYHAETEAIYQACQTLGGWRLWQCCLYVTLEPCAMCAGAILNARLARVVYGAPDVKNGFCGSVLNLFQYGDLPKPEIVSGVMEQACAAELSAFFAQLRRKDKESPAVFLPDMQ